MPASNNTRKQQYMNNTTKNASTYKPIQHISIICVTVLATLPRTCHMSQAAVLGGHDMVAHGPPQGVATRRSLTRASACGSPLRVGVRSLWCVCVCVCVCVRALSDAPTTTACREYTATPADRSVVVHISLYQYIGCKVWQYTYHYISTTVRGP